MNYYNIQPGIMDSRREFHVERHPSNLGFSDNNEYKPFDVHKVNGKLLDNIVEYNKNLTEDEINGTNISNITKFNNLITLSEFDKMLIAEQYNRLYGKSKLANEQRNFQIEKNKLINMPLGEIANNFTATMAELIQELPVEYDSNTISIDTFTKNDRLTYIGILFILIGMFLYFVH